MPDGQWYLHLFAPQQPDLNWENEQVRADFRTTLKFWSDRGVDGFRIDVAHALVKDLTEPLRDLGAPELSSEAALADFAPGTHPFYDRDDVHEVYRDWRKIFDTYTPPRMAVAEAWVPGARRALYARPDELGQAFNFEYLQGGWDAAELREIITGSLADARAAAPRRPGCSPTTTWSATPPAWCCRRAPTPTPGCCPAAGPRPSTRRRDCAGPARRRC